MAYFWADTFDCYAAPADAVNGYWDSGTTSGFTLVAGRFSGSQAMQSASNTAWLVKSSGQNDALHHIVCAFQQTAALTGSGMYGYFQLSDGATNQVCIVFRQDGAIVLTSATPGGAALATYTGAVTATSTWYAFEIEVFISATAGYMNVRKNGNISNDFASATNLNTRPGTNSYANKLTIGYNALNSAQLFDDVIWRSDATSVPWIGDVRGWARRPVSDASVQWSQAGSGTFTQSVVGAASAAISNVSMRLTPYTIAYPGNITSIVIVTASTAAGNMKCAIYADNAGVPGVVLASAGPITTVAAGNNIFTVSPSLAVTVGQKIWLAVLDDTSAGSYQSLNVPAVGGTAAATYATFPLPNPVMSTGQVQVSSQLTIVLPVSNYALVQEPQQDAASTYVYSSTVGNSDLYGISSISSTPATVVAVTTRAYLQKTDAGNRSVAVQLKSGPTTVQSASTALNTTWGWISRTDTTDPNGGGPLTAVAVNNMQIGAVVTV